MHRHMVQTARVAFVALLAGALALAAQRNVSAAGLLIADGGFGGVLEIKEQTVQVTINNGIAVTDVTQVFHNTENRVVEALYTFPVPAGASVANFSMWINGKEMVGEVVEKQRARQIYESYKQTRRDPGLLEQVDYKRFEMRIFPIPAGADQKVKIEYYQELDFDHDWAVYVYPLATVSRPEASGGTAGKLSFSLEVKSQIPIVEVKSPSHADDFVAASHTPNYYRASYEATDGDLARDIVLNCHLERPRTGLDLITSRQEGEDGYFLLTLTTGKELEEVNTGMDYAFVVDASGSMADDGKLRLSRECVMAFVGGLGGEDRFEMITFNITPTTLFQQLRTADAEAVAAADEFLQSQRARGGTVLRPAIQTAYKYKDADRPLNVVVLSDGMTEQKEQDELVRLIKQSPSGARVFCVGVGNEVNRHLLSQLADEAGGLAAFISRGDDFQRQADAFRRKLTRPAGTNLKLSFAGAEVYDVSPDRLPNLYHGAPLRVYGRYRQPGPLTLTLEGDVLGAPLEHKAELTLPVQDAENPEIERMWAYQQVEQLLRLARERGDTGSTDPPIVKVIGLCEEYSIVSEYASFIVLENDAEYQRWKIDRRNALRLERDRGARQRLREDLVRLQERTLDEIGPALAAAEPPPAEVQTLSNQVSPLPSSPQPAPSDSWRSRVRQSFDIPVFEGGGGGGRGGGGGGGGAIDPISGLAAAGLAGASWLAARRRRRVAGAKASLQRSA